jgi:hypothetical protein
MTVIFLNDLAGLAITTSSGSSDSLRAPRRSNLRENTHPFFFRTATGESASFSIGSGPSLRAGLTTVLARGGAKGTIPGASSSSAISESPDTLDTSLGAGLDLQEIQ